MTVLTFEEHSSVLPAWWERGLTSRTLIYLDAHLDLQQINPISMRALQQCETPDSMKKLEKPHYLYPDRGYSYGIENFLFAAHRLGLVDQLVWVVPPHIGLDYSEQVFAQLQQLDGVTFEELISFHRSPQGWIEGTLLGLRITICDIRQLADMQLRTDSLIDIDIDFFLTVPGDRIWSHPRAIFSTLRRLPLSFDLVTISNSVDSGFMPLRFRFVTDFLAALWENREKESSHFDRLFALTSLFDQGDAQNGLPECYNELRRYPDCPATHHLIGLWERDRQNAVVHHHQAAELCTAYGPNRIRSLCEILNRDLPYSDRVEQTPEQQLSPVHQDGDQQKALIHIAGGLIQCRRGNLGEAIAEFEQSAAVLDHHPQLALEIAKGLLRIRKFEQAKHFFQFALSDDKTRTSANVYLAQIKQSDGFLDDAIRHLVTANESAPAWMEIRRMLASAYSRIGNQQQSTTLLHQYHEQMRHAARLPQQLSNR